MTTATTGYNQDTLGSWISKDASAPGGGVGKVYTVTAAITTADGLIDRRSFRIKVENRSA